MTYLIGVLLLALVGCAVTIYRLSGENDRLAGIVDELAESVSDHAIQLHYARERNKTLNAELLNASVTRPNTATASTSSLPAEHPQKRVKSIRGKRK